MSLRLLEQVTRRLTNDWRMLDAGTGSGILALAGKRFGAGDVVGIDNDPLAISTAKQNARCNRIRGVKFVTGDIAKNITGKYDIITANLYSELLVSLLPQFRKNLAAQGHLILSGVLRKQEPQLLRALKSNAFQIHTIRRRGKWIALLCSRG
jgi:ribosomal protein L11 methyltransferase